MSSVVYRFVRQGGRYKLVSTEHADFLLRRGIGVKVGDDVLLDPLEVAYLAVSHKVVVDGAEVKLLDIVKDIDNFLKLNVYLDLRRRGYYVKLITDEAPVDLLLWEKGKRPGEHSPRYGVKIVTEGTGVKVADLSRTLKYCESMGLQLVLALVSGEGVITYYKAFSFRAIR